MSFRRRACLNSDAQADAGGAIRGRDSGWPARPRLLRLLLVALPVADLADPNLT